MVNCSAAAPPMEGMHQRLPHMLQWLIAGSPYIAPISIFDSTAHLLHGVLHANGFGHLMRINGLEGGSENVTGKALHTLSASILLIV